MDSQTPSTETEVRPKSGLPLSEDWVREEEWDGCPFFCHQSNCSNVVDDAQSTTVQQDKKPGETTETAEGEKNCLNCFLKGNMTK